MREKTTITVEQADEVVSIIKPLDVEALSLEDRLTVLYAWEYISRTYDIPLITGTHKSLGSVLAHCIQSLTSEEWRKRGEYHYFNDTDELFTALRSLRQTVETT